MIYTTLVPSTWPDIRLDLFIGENILSRIFEVRITYIPYSSYFLIKEKHQLPLAIYVTSGTRLERNLTY